MSSPKFYSPTNSQTKMLGLNQNLGGNKGEGGRAEQISVQKTGTGSHRAFVVTGTGNTGQWTAPSSWQLYCQHDGVPGTKMNRASPSGGRGCDGQGCDYRVGARCESWGGSSALTLDSRVGRPSGRGRLPDVHLKECGQRSSRPRKWAGKTAAA